MLRPVIRSSSCMSIEHAYKGKHRKNLRSPFFALFSVNNLFVEIPGDQKVSIHLTITVQYNPHTTYGLKMAITEYIRNAILNTVFENTARRVNKCLETGRGHFEHYL
jgi:hypothetical protein